MDVVVRACINTSLKIDAIICRRVFLLKFNSPKMSEYARNDSEISGNEARNGSMLFSGGTPEKRTKNAITYDKITNMRSTKITMNFIALACAAVMIAPG